jgi:hypothetical protein
MQCLGVQRLSPMAGGPISKATTERLVSCRRSGRLRTAGVMGTAFVRAAQGALEMGWCRLQDSNL